MKKKISMSVKTIVYVILFFVGVLMALYYGRDYMMYKHPLDMSIVGGETLKKNTYVSCSVDEYYVKCIDRYYYGTVRSFSNGIDDFDYYAVRMYDGSYIEIGIYDIGMRNDLENFNTGKGKPVNFVGRVTVAGDVNEEWFEDAEGFDITKLNKEYQIVQVHGALGWNRFLIGIFLAAASLFGFFTSFTVYYVDEQKLDEYGEAAADKNGVRSRSYGKNKAKKSSRRRSETNLNHELVIVKKRIENIKKDINKLRRWIIGGIACILFGAIIIVAVHNTLMLIGVILCLFGVERLWKVFFNSGNKLAVSLAEMFGIRTLHRRLKLAEAKKAEIEGEIERENELKNEKPISTVRADSVMIDCEKQFENFMIKLENDTYYAFKDGDRETQLLINTDEENGIDKYLLWGERKRDIAGVLNFADRDSYFIHFGEINGLWMVAKDSGHNVLAIASFRLYDNGNIDMENLNYGLDCREGEILNPEKLRLRRKIKCIGDVTAMAEYRLNNTVKPELTKECSSYYSVDSEYCEEAFEIVSDSPVCAWFVNEKEKNVDDMMDRYMTVKVPSGTRFRRLRTPKKAFRSYVDVLLEDGNIMRVIEEYKFNETESYQVMTDAEGKQFEYRAVGQN